MKQPEPLENPEPPGSGRSSTHPELLIQIASGYGSHQFWLYPSVAFNLIYHSMTPGPVHYWYGGRCGERSRYHSESLIGSPWRRVK